MNRLRLELNRHGRYKVRFLNENESVDAARAKVLRDRQDAEIRARVSDLAKEIVDLPICRQNIKIAVLPILNTNMVNMNADSFAGMLRSEISRLSDGKVQLLMPGVTQGADYYLAGQFFPQSMKAEGIINLANYVEVLDQRIKEGRPLNLSDSVYVNATPGASTVVAVSKREDALLELLRNPELYENPNVDKLFNVMLVKVDSKVVAFEKVAMLDKKISDCSGQADYILSCELSDLTAQRGEYKQHRSNFVLITFQLTDPDTNNIVWEDGVEVKWTDSIPDVYN